MQILRALLIGALVSPLPHLEAAKLSNRPVQTEGQSNSVSPNLMFIMDTSGSMNQPYTPDWIRNSEAYCRGKACDPGMPAFASTGFNSQYYNPEVSYTPPQRADGSSYPKLNKTNTSAWTQVPIDGFRVQNYAPFDGSVYPQSYDYAAAANIDLTSRYPDLQWCDGNNVCQRNLRTSENNDWLYPDANYTTAYRASGAPYYFTMRADTYCTDDSGQNCIRSSSPSGQYTHRLNLLWCNSADLNNPGTLCRARRDDMTFKYVSFVGSTAGGNPSRYRLSIRSAGSSKTASYTVISSIKFNNIEQLAAGEKLYTAYMKDGNEKRNQIASLIGNKLSNLSPSACSFTATASYADVWVSSNTSAPASNACNNLIGIRVSATDTRGNPNLSYGYIQGSDTLDIAPTQFKRVDITPDGAAYFPRKHANRQDCAGTVCSYEEEMTNFANWFSYYRTRMQTMKSAASLSFNKLGNEFRVGFINLWGTQFKPVETFSGNHRSNWYDTLFSQKPYNGTPLREALSRVGRYFAGKGMNNQSGLANPVQYSCQQNFALLTTDGYWNGNGGLKLDGSSLSNSYDSAPDSRSQGIYDGLGTDRQVSDGPTPTLPWKSDFAGVTGLSNGSLADVAAYYYNTDLSEGSLAKNVPGSPSDPAVWQHMTTFTLGLGVDGRMRYTPNYKSGDTDFNRIVRGEKGCAWNSDPNAICNWPIPEADKDTAVDDLWHAAINGHGQYFSAKQPKDVVDGLSAALSAIKSETGSAAAAATSTPIITSSDNQLFVSNYRTIFWDGDLQNYLIDPEKVQISATPSWSSREKINATPATQRRIYTRASNGSRVEFSYDSLDASTKAWFSSQGAMLSQYDDMDAGKRAIANDGTALVNYLRGDRSNENTFRKREYVLGDMANSAPVFVKAPLRKYTDQGYASYRDNWSSRTGIEPNGMVLVGSNDGFLHAIRGGSNGGDELWAFAPRQTLAKMAKLASNAWASTEHRFLVDGSPVVEDVAGFNNGVPEWHTIVVGGLNKGGRGFYALDITNPTDPKPLWEFCDDASLCSSTTSNIGYSYGNPVISKRVSDGRWVVYLSSGYLDGSSLRGRIFVLDALNGRLLDTLETPQGDGLAKLAPWLENYNINNTATALYGADLTGNVWKFSLDQILDGHIPVQRIATLSDGSRSQSVTTAPVLTRCQNKRMVLLGTGRYLHLDDVTDSQTNSIYGFVDDIDPANSSRQDLATSDHMVRQTFSLSSKTSSKTPVLLSTHDGWVMDLAAGSGERVNINPNLTSGIFVVHSNVPSANPQACDFGGKSRSYELNYCSGIAVKFTERPSMLAGSTKVYLTQKSGGAVPAEVLIPITGQAILNPVSDYNLNNTLRAPRTSWREILP